MTTTSPELHWRSAAELGAGLVDGGVSSVELTEALIRRCDDVEPHIGAILHRTDERA
ncbi:MAG: Asp-tRNA(Asn)/Glu-tRNA(Gln) amidotransferase GatCAB subunit A, partial [Actinobacteria bacterium]|nr:Asp-tRNA(Asn)/Glu-tRNA(Gln) amidotransferase GatCAB subunit A [Actinomycetota bacterium]